MKGKLALLALLSTVVTVGSVYATWTFAENPTKNTTTTVNIAMTGLSSESEKGQLTIEALGTPSFTMAIDDDNKDHLPELYKKGTVKVTFKPSDSASQEVKTNGINIITYATYAAYEGGPASLAEWKYEGVQIFNITTNEAAPRHLQYSDATNVGGSFVWEIDASVIGISLTDDFAAMHIDTLEKYNALNAVLAKGHFVLNAQECTEAHS